MSGILLGQAAGVPLAVRTHLSSAKSCADCHCMQCTLLCTTAAANTGRAPIPPVPGPAVCAAPAVMRTTLRTEDDVVVTIPNKVRLLIPSLCYGCKGSTGTSKLEMYLTVC